MSIAVVCRTCQKSIPVDAPLGECPACLLLLGLLDTPEGGIDGTIAGTVAAATVSASGFASSDPDATLLTRAIPLRKKADWPKIPGYEITAELGSGGGGVVYKALQLKAGKRVVALKVLHGASKHERDRIKRETASLGQLSHPNIVTIHEVGDSADGPYFTMEYMSEGNLAELIKSNRPSPKRSAEIVEALAQGVAASHKAGILHRDLKPSNILLNEQGIPKISDFGLAKLADDRMDSSSLERMTPAGTILGTPAYMAPEQATGRTKEIDERTDVYGLGAVLYHCLTGSAPFTGESHVEIAHQVVHEELVPPRSVDRSVPKGLEGICLLCLKKNKSNRYGSSAAVGEDLGRWLRNEIPNAAPLGHIGRATLWARRNSRVLVRSALFLAVGAFAVVLIATMPWKPEPAKTAATEPVEPALDRLNRQLDAGKAIVVPSEGLPAWEFWPHGAAKFDLSPMNDGTASFQTMSQSLVDLMVPYRDRYRVSLEVRLLKPRDANGLELPVSTSTDFVGLALGRQEFLAENGSRLQSMIVVGYTETLSEQDKRLAKGRSHVKTKGYVLSSKRDAIMAPHMQGLANDIPFQPIDAGPGPWRALQADVTPQGVRLRWRPTSNAPWEEIARLTPAMIEQCFRDISTRLPKEVRAAHAGYSYVWNPKTPLGLLARNAYISVRNYELEPLPPTE